MSDRENLPPVTVIGLGPDHILRTSQALGVDPALPEAVKRHYDQAIAAGHGGKDWTVLYELIKAPG